MRMDEKMNSVIRSDKYRISVLTDRLIRLEYSREGRFEDRITEAVINRELDHVEPVIRHEGNDLVVETGELLLRYDEKEFSTNGLSIELKKTGKVWHYSIVFGNSDGNLFGTARTLDGKDGSTYLEPGIFGRNGYAVLDDSNSPVLEEKESSREYVLRNNDSQDLYFFGYGKDYYGGLRDFFRLCGNTPMIPRYALGNWWSRYYRYSEESYREVIRKFKEEGIPLSVAVIDMDWHVTEVDPKYGTGWTGYSWNKDLFPDHKRFLKMLHDNGLAVTLNLHPADGVRAFEDMYGDVARDMGIDPETEQEIEFDFGNSNFRNAYFKDIMHPYEEDGVDFWWIDWQQGTGKKARDVDPLFLLNHYHYKDQEGRNVRPMIFSRYAGPGSHRYPVGFSGDTVTSWKSLDFQPYFTSTASNIGYGWWSHDIGGHMLGDKNNERLVRWVQYGVFSPIMRLHSTNSPFFNKEPWVIEEPYHSVMKKYMRLRHRLIPYLYTEGYRTYTEGKPLVRPMYYDNPDNEEAYNVGTEFGFGDQLIVGAITKPCYSDIRMAYSHMFIPKGRYVDIDNGRVYSGNKRRKLYRDINEIPVLMKAGGILPLSMEDRTNGTDNPEKLELIIAAGADGSYTMYEDDGKSMEYQKGAFCKTPIECIYDEKSGDVTVMIKPSEGDLTLIPNVRDIKITVMGVRVKDSSKAGKDVICVSSRKALSFWLCGIDPQKGANAVISGIEMAENDHIKEVFNILERAWIENRVKDLVYNAVTSLTDEQFLKWLKGADISETLKDAITEVFED